jgi:hypothetical protein
LLKGVMGADRREGELAGGVDRTKEGKIQDSSNLKQLPRIRSSAEPTKPSTVKQKQADTPHRVEFESRPWLRT